MSLAEPFLPPGEQLLVSCCNVGHFGSRYSVAVVSSEGVSWLDLDDVIDPSTDIGVAGLAATDQGCFLALQGTRPRIVRLDFALQASALHECEHALDVHSLAEHKGVLYVTSTGRNEILALGCGAGRFTGHERVHVRAVSAGKDVVHLNSLCFAGDTLLYSMFGRRAGLARNGALVNAATGAPVLEGLRDPHSLITLGDDRLAYCESLTGMFCHLELASGAQRRVHLDGYTRGCTFTGRHFVVGTSRWRHRSRSLGSFKEQPPSTDPHGNPWQRSALYFLNPDLSVAQRLDFTAYAPEIYDVAYVGRRFVPGRVFEDAAARRLDALYDEIHQDSRPERTYYRRRA